MIPPLRDLVRMAVLKSNSYWPFSWSNRGLYQLAVSAFARTFASDPEISALYVRHSLAGDGWTPGSSDIDLSVILRTGLSPEREFAFLESFWRRFSRLKRFWPMLGEVDLLDERELPAWMYYSARTPHPAGWRLLRGRDVAAGAISPESAARWRVRSLKMAYWFYRERFLPSLTAGSHFLAAKDRQRLARKILSLTADVTRSAPPRLAELEEDAGMLFFRVLEALDSATAESGPPFPSEGRPFGPSLRITAEGVISVLFDESGTAFVILREVPKPASLIASRTACLGLRSPIFLTPAMFRFFVRQYEPQQYWRMHEGRTIAFGADPLPACAPPSREQIEGAVLDQIPNVLLFPRSWEIFPDSGAFPLGQMQAALRQILRILLVRSDALTSDQLRQLTPASRIFGANEFRRLEEIAAAAGPGPEARWHAFLFFKELSAKVLHGTVPGRGRNESRRPHAPGESIRGLAKKHNRALFDRGMDIRKQHGE